VEASKLYRRLAQLAVALHHNNAEIRRLERKRSDNLAKLEMLILANEQEINTLMDSKTEPDQKQ
jgi:hypothetical protein